MFLAELVFMVCAGACVASGLLQSESESSEEFPEVPDYVGALELLKMNGQVLRSLLPYKSLQVTDPRRHYVIIAGVLGCTVEYLNSDCTPPDYDNQFFPVVDRLLPIIWQHPNVATEKLDAFVADSERAAKPILDLKTYYCKNTLAEVCNHILMALSYANPRLTQALDFLESVGKLASIYESNRFIEDAMEYNELSVLLKGKETLKPLVYQAADVYNRLYGKRCHLKK